jgi:hypothetical protein
MPPLLLTPGRLCNIRSYILCTRKEVELPFVRVTLPTVMFDESKVGHFAEHLSTNDCGDPNIGGPLLDEYHLANYVHELAARRHVGRP